VSWLTAGIFSIEIVTRFCTGIVIVNRMRRALIMDRRIVALHYMLHGPFLLDLAVVATLWAEVRLSSDEGVFPEDSGPSRCKVLSRPEADAAADA
jgi:hypothetical protein